MFCILDKEQEARSLPRSRMSRQCTVDECKAKRERAFVEADILNCTELKPEQGKEQGILG